MPQLYTLRRTGFTLVELAIVLVIIGLIVGGILVGQTLVKAATLNGIVRDVQTYNGVVQTFRTKYNAMPGDMRNATEIWGAVNATPATCRISSGTGTQTCDGNGDGLVSATAGTDDWERDRFWQHMQIAGLVDYGLTGVNPGSAFVQIGINAPRSKINGGGYSVSSLSNVGTFGGTIFSGTIKGAHLILFGAQVTNALNTGAILLPEDAFNLDTKADDAKPASGKIFGVRNGGNAPATTCLTTDVQATAAYDLTQTTPQCALIFSTSF